MLWWLIFWQQVGEGALHIFSTVPCTCFLNREALQAWTSSVHTITWRVATGSLWHWHSHPIAFHISQLALVACKVSHSATKGVHPVAKNELFPLCSPTSSALLFPGLQSPFCLPHPHSHPVKWILTRTLQAATSLDCADDKQGKHSSLLGRVEVGYRH